MVRIISELLAQPLKVHTHDGARIGFGEVVALGGLDQLARSDHAIGVGGKVIKRVKLRRGQFKQLVFLHYQMLLPVNGQSGRFDKVLASRRVNGLLLSVLTSQCLFDRFLTANTRSFDLLKI